MDGSPYKDGKDEKVTTAQLSKELETFEAHKDDLLGTSKGKYVLIHGETLIGPFDSEHDAISRGYEQFGNVPFLVKQVLEVEIPLNFVSGRLAL